MNRILFSILSLFAFTCARAVETPVVEAPAPSPFSATASVNYASRYLFRGDELAGHSIQANVNAQYGSLYANIWANQGVRAHQTNETDFAVGYSQGDTGFDAGVSAYTYRELNEFSGDKWVTWEPYIGYRAKLKDVSASLYAFRDFTLHTLTFESKVSQEISLSKSLSVEVAGALGTSHGRDSLAYWYWEGGLTAKYALSDKASLSAGASYHNTSSLDHGRDLIVYTGGIEFSF